jgi:glutamate synthase domain-containing protein 2/glutamate synthase domain-containing protein 3
MRFFGKPAISIEGMGMGDIALEIIKRLDQPWKRQKLAASRDPRAFNPKVVKSLIKAARRNSREEFEKFTAMVDQRTPIAIRDLLEIESSEKNKVDPEEVESPEEIIRKYFRGAAMSHGALKRAAHQDIATAFNSFNSMSNSGEGGENPARGKKGKLDFARSRIRQVASGRFGVDALYLVNANEIHIKIAQGSKPGEGGQLSGRKVDEEIARNRHTKSGIGLISPPPHHDIYSIEDLAQLIYDLKNVNPSAKISVKLTSGSQVGVIGVGVAKCGADIIEIDGFDGGTGASLASSIEHAGLPLELGLSDVHSSLVENNLRHTVKLRVGGGIKTASDVIKLALLGADEFSFGTTLMVAVGCIMCRKCHIPDCSTGITSNQEPYKGDPEHVRNYLLHIAEGVRDKLAEMGQVSLRKIVGKSRFLKQVFVPDFPRANKLELSGLLPVQQPKEKELLSNSRLNSLDIQTNSVNNMLVIKARETLEKKLSQKLTIRQELTNTDRAVGTTLAGKIADKYGRKGFPGRITCRFNGQAGQSFGAFMVNGMKFILEGMAEDGVGKGMSGGRLIVRYSGPRRQDPHQSLAGNNVCYGATGGECFIGGNVGQRLGIRNSGAIIVTKGAGKYACEYMTGGIVVVIGEVEQEIGAGMSSGTGYFRDPENLLKEKIYKTSVAVHNCHQDDFKTLLSILKKFQNAVKTEYVQNIISGWEEEKKCFRKVLPLGTG